MGGVKALMDTVVALAGSERDAIFREGERLATERSRVQQVFNPGELVTLNIGGTKFTTTVATLRNAPPPSLLEAMFSGRHAVSTAEDGSVFIDRDSRHFGDVLNFLRTGQLAYPKGGTDFKYLLELRAEAEFYGLLGLVARIDCYPWSVVRATRAGAINEDEEDEWDFTGSEDEVVFTVSAPCQLMGIGLCGTRTGYHASIKVLRVKRDDFDIELEILWSGEHTVTSADGKVARVDLPAPIELACGPTYKLQLEGEEGTSSFRAEDCLQVVVAGGVRIEYEEHHSPNNTCEHLGQFPELWIRVVGGP
ncbi:hypothetical protein Rsub_10605 [Raphidocelis subcapitata]|uniref:BTB domain-containing protein n=1 Tax=Raphidocelis subcapitata TaxID=307507 RepID=A0A2V0PFZ3_9CHLO|nr:hypothetical protein Rsub_10605 [Raphidocelis subcapitata]|eukprot:GBF97932.1 hypothetical protein Rsub_10605 [Raphidocelis subcapitata]